MKKLLLALFAVAMTALNVNAQTSVESPHSDLSVKVMSCSYTSGTVVIDMLLTNLGEDMEFDTRGSGVIAYDDQGNAYNSKSSKVLVGIANQSLKISAKYLLPQDVPVKFRIQLDNVSADASKFSIFKFAPHYSSYDHNHMEINKDSYIVFRNLTWSE
ncbi:MAG: hypothetical protein SNJ29_12765 [Rikenellaceae bacterium]